MNGTGFCRTFYYTGRVEHDYCREKYDEFYPVFYESLQKKGNTDIIGLIADEVDKFQHFISAEFRKNIESATRNLRALINIEQNKNPAALQPNWKNIYSSAAVNPLSGPKPSGDGGAAAEASLAVISRMEKTMCALKDYPENPDFGRLPLLVSRRFAAFYNHDLQPLFRGCQVQVLEDDKPVAAVNKLISDYMNSLLPAIRNLRIFALDKKKKYRPEIHDDFFKCMTWTDFSKEEMALCPPLIFLDTEEGSCGAEAEDFCGLLSSGANVKVFMFRTNTPGIVQKVEPAKMAMALNSVYVFQSSADQISHFQKGLVDGLSFPGSAFFFHLLTTEDFTADFLAGAAASRYFPDFCFNPALEDKWGVKPDISGNQQIDQDWLNLKFTIDNKTENAAFTYGDFLFTQADCRGLFMVIPDDWQPENMLFLADYIAADTEKQCESLPFIILRNKEGVSCRAICNKQVVQACLERRNNWRRLCQQADKGLENAWLERGRKIAELEAEHAVALKKEAKKTARNVLDKLASVLLDLSEQDNSLAVPAKKEKGAESEAEKAEVSEQKTATVTQKTPAQVSESADFEESWIDSPSCASCNECININGAMFKYDDNKKAYIDDVHAGTFAQLVQAAESCALSLIHVGDPWNPDEPGLEKLLQKAKPFRS
jgi:ferredoxin